MLCSRQCVVLFLGILSAVGASELRVTYTQTNQHIIFNFGIGHGDFTSFFFHATFSGEKSLIRLVFENDAEQKFYRVHLAHTVLPHTLRAEVTPEGVKLTAEKLESNIWEEIVLFSSESAVRATIRVQLSQTAELPIEMAEFHDPREAVMLAVKEARQEEALDATAIRKIAEVLTEAVDRATPRCLAHLHCECDTPLVFDGRECMDGGKWAKLDGRRTERDRDVGEAGRALDFAGYDGHRGGGGLRETGKWAKLDVRLTSPGGLLANTDRLLMQTDTFSDQPALWNSPDLLQLEAGVFAHVFTAHQQAAQQSSSWPRVFYAQGFRGKKVLAVGAGLQNFEAILFAQQGAAVTVIDRDVHNLRAMERLRVASDVPPSSLALVHCVEHVSLLQLPSDFDAVLALDSMTRAPGELMRAEYTALASRLKVGGRWLQLAPSKERYLKEKQPRLKRFGAAEKKSAANETYWYDWLDIKKLRHLLQPSNFDVLFEVKGANEASGKHEWIWFDLLRVS
ncbi:hypothetical protein CYMTET_52863 [Cymbomonas tetramitiformis]|uniref:Methyltransferase domain-containing protein n=1 Tax=Cymbomonas tetramitiformis TaxID=36881 RepID=A0AAE0BJH8_9CHLO|nr:hypothetical protein CYMTET_52863 [Cymbomonas tetramitiformis]